MVPNSRDFLPRPLARDVLDAPSAFRVYLLPAVFTAKGLSITGPAFILGAQYYRPPFPSSSHWEDDLKGMRDAGLNAVQLWLIWGWCEPQPGKFVFDDYDRIADIAAKRELGLVLSTLPEINPFWVPRVHADAMMVDIEGRPVACCNRWECLSGLAPGACSDHPEIRKRMTDFLAQCARHFAPRENLLAWDCWNENRWRDMALDYVCFCPHSLESLREFLKSKYGSLENLSEAWGRRYDDWADVRVGRMFGYSYPEWHDFTEWICRRAKKMIGWRSRALRENDPRHVVSSHTGNPSVFGGANMNETLFSRGVDWDIAEADGYGYSSFPAATGPGAMSAEEFCVRASAVATAGKGKPFWMSELQGGPTAGSGRFGPPLTGAEQQAWIWTGISRGAKAVILWCWRSEVFGIESNGYGITADDGLASDRLRALRLTAQTLSANEGKIASFKPDAPEVAVLFQRDSYFYGWMAKNHLNSPYLAPARFLAWPKALERLNVHYEIRDDRHLPDDPGALKLVIVPDARGLDDAAADWLVRFARSGGTIFVEGAAGAFGPDTWFRALDRRPFYQAIGVIGELHRAVSLAKRTIPPRALANPWPIPILLEEFESAFRPNQKQVFRLPPDGLPLLVNKVVGKGRAVCLGSLIGDRMTRESPRKLDELVACLLKLAGVQRAVSLRATGRGFCSARLGSGGGRRLLIVTNFGAARNVTILLRSDLLAPGAKPVEWFAHKLTRARRGSAVHLTLKMKPHDHAVIEW